MRKKWEKRSTKSWCKP